MDTNTRYAYALMNERCDEPAEDRDRASERVQFSLQRDTTVVTANVPTHYFDAHVLPVITALLDTMSAADGGRDGAQSQEEDLQRRGAPPTVRDIVEKLGGTSGPELMKAAAVSLSVFKDMPLFTREQLVKEAERAIGHWRKAHSKTVDVILDYLISSGCLVEQVNGELCLNPAEEKAAILSMRG